MSMQRAQILFDHDQYGRLRRVSRRSGRSVGALVREAVDSHFPPTRDTKRGVTKIRSVSDIDLGEWHEIKAELRSGIFGAHSDA